MERRRIKIQSEDFPASAREFLSGAEVYDSSCSPDARVWFIDRDGGYYLKSAASGTLRSEALMTDFFHGKGLSAEVLAYEPADRDWLLTRRIPGEDCLDRQYLDDPKRLSETLGILLRQLHETDPAGCPVSNCMEHYLDSVARNHRDGRFDPTLFLGNPPFRDVQEAWDLIQNGFLRLRQDTLLHGDYCLPNVVLNNWHFSAFLDVGSGGIGDRHIDLFWGVWSLAFNLKTDFWCNRFLDAYGRDLVDLESLRVIAACECFR